MHCWTLETECKEKNNTFYYNELVMLSYESTIDTG